MKQKLIFDYHILIFNIIKFLPCSSSYFNNHFLMPTQSLTNHDTHYNLIVKFGKAQFGWTGIFLANVALMLFCLPLFFLQM
ncbi:MAG TPA: hypothetical protein VIL26_03465 [Clostridia bacterium]